jgi:hypothetical protein
MLDAAWRREEKGIRMTGLRPVCHRFSSPLFDRFSVAQGGYPCELIGRQQALVHNEQPSFEIAIAQPFFNWLR